MFLYVYISWSLLTIALCSWHDLKQKNKITLFDLFISLVLWVFSWVWFILVISEMDMFDDLERFDVTLFEKKKKE